MSEIPKRPDEGESTLDNKAPGAWQTVSNPGHVTPAAAGQVLPPGYSVQPPPGAQPPSSPLPGGGAGYQPVYGGSPTSGYGGPVYGSQPAGQPMPYGQGFPQQGNYGVNVAEMLAVGAIVGGVRRRQRRAVRRFILLPILLILGVVALGLYGCVRAINSAGRTEVTELHNRMKRDDLAGIFNAAAPEYKTAGRAHSDALFQAVHDQLGDPVDYTVGSTSMSTNNGTGNKVVVLKTKFSRADATETVRFHKESGGTYKLFSYQVVSPDFHYDGTIHEDTF